LRKALDGEFSPVSSPESPLIDRQFIRRSVEQELKAACKLLVERTGNAHHNSNEDALANFSHLQRSVANKPSNVRRVDSKLSAKALDPKSEGSIPISLEIGSKPMKISDHDRTMSLASRPPERSTSRPQQPAKEDKKLDGPVEATKESNRPQFPTRKDSLSTSRKHTQLRKHAATDEDLPMPPLIASIVERPRTAPADSGDESCESPMSASTTEQAPQSASTAFTSVAITPAKTAYKPSQPSPLDPKVYQDAVTRAERKAAELMKLRNESVEIKEETRTSVATQTLPTSVEKPLGGLRGFVGNRSTSRSRSREPGSTLSRTASTLQSWRNGWNMRRKASTSSLSDMVAPLEGNPKNASDVNLNRALPPLPGLDTYKEEPEKISTGTDKPVSSKAIVMETLTQISNTVRPKTSGGMSTSSRGMSIEVRPKTGRERSSSGRTCRRQPSVTIETAVPVPVRKFSIAESKASSQDSCFSPTGTDFGTPKRSIDLMKAASMAHAQSIDSLRALAQAPVQAQTQAKKEPELIAHKSNTTSRHASRPPSRGGVKSALASASKFPIAPHQRTPSQPVLYSRSAGSSLVNLPARPATRDASSAPSRSRLPSVSSHSQLALGHYPPLPANFSRKIAEGSSRPSTAVGAGSKPGTEMTGSEITALPQVPARKGKGLRRIISSMSIRKSKVREMPWMEREGVKSSHGILAA
jgi:hypothetical protein